MTQRIDWAISRMRRILEIWRGMLDDADKRFILRSIRDEEPDLFREIFQEKFTVIMR